MYYSTSPPSQHSTAGQQYQHSVCCSFSVHHPCQLPPCSPSSVRGEKRSCSLTAFTMVSPAPGKSEVHTAQVFQALQEGLSHALPLEWGNSNTDRPELKATEISAPSDQHAMLLSVPATAPPRLRYPCTVPSMDGQDCWQSSLILIKGLLTVLENHRLEAEPVFAPWVEPRLKQQNQSTANKCYQRKKKENQQQWLWNSLFSSF